MNPLKILLAEDSEADVKIALRAFEKSGAPAVIRTVRNGQEALDFLYGRPSGEAAEPFVRPDVVLLDLNMPRVDGFAVIAAMKSDLNLREIPIVIMTTSRNAGDVHRAYQAGAASYLPKPADYPDFVRMVGGFCAYWQSVSLLPGRAE